MFMIVSQKGRNLIAIGDRLLKVWGIADVYDAAQAYESGRIKFDRRNRIVQLGEGRRLKCQISEMSSVIGKLSLCDVKVPVYKKEDDFCNDDIGNETAYNVDESLELEIDDNIEYISDEGFIDRVYREEGRRDEKIKAEARREDEAKARRAREDEEREARKRREDEEIKARKIREEEETKARQRREEEEIKARRLREDEEKRRRKRREEEEIKARKKREEETKSKKRKVSKSDFIDSKGESKKVTESKQSPKEPEKESSQSVKVDSEDDIFSFDDLMMEDKKSRKPESKIDKELSGIMGQPKDMESTLDGQTVKRKGKEREKSKRKNVHSKDDMMALEDNSQAIDIDSLLMDDDASISMESKSPSTQKGFAPENRKKEGRDKDDFELGDIFNEIESEKDRRGGSKKGVKDEFDLDTILDKSGDDSGRDSFNIDDLLGGDSLDKEERVSDKDKRREDVKKRDDDLDLDLMFGIDEDNDEFKPKQKTDSRPKQKERESKKVDEDLDLDIDSLFDDIPMEKEKRDSRKTEESDDFGIDDIDFDNLFDDDMGKKEPQPKQKPQKQRSRSPEMEPFSIDFDDDELLNIGGERETPSRPKDTQDDDSQWQKIVDEIDIDLSKNAERIEFSEEDYEDLIESFIKDSKDMENTLRFGTPKDKASEVSILSDAITILHLNPLDKLLHKIAKGRSEEINNIIDAFYKILDGIEEKIQQSRDKREFGTNRATPKSEPKVGATPQKEPKTEKTVDNSTSMQIVSVDEFLKDVKIVPIEFSVKMAADELNLPEDLVLEFVNDFSNQGHEYIPELIDAYQSGDLDKLQKTAHMLKGAASNLRIEPMVQNLYDLQFDNDLNRAPERIKLFAGQLMSLDQYLRQISNN